LLPVEVRLADGRRPRGVVAYQVNRTKDGYLVALFNHRGIDKTQTGIARVDRRAPVGVVLETARPLRMAGAPTDPQPAGPAHAAGRVAWTAPTAARTTAPRRAGTITQPRPRVSIGGASAGATTSSRRPSSGRRSSCNSSGT